MAIVFLSYYLMLTVIFRGALKLLKTVIIHSATASTVLHEPPNSIQLSTLLCVPANPQSKSYALLAGAYLYPRVLKRKIKEDKC